MRTMTTLALAAALGLGLTGAALAESRNYDLKDFDRIDIATGIDAVVSIGDTFSVKADSGSSDALDNLTVDVSGGVLKASIDQSFLDFIVSGGFLGQLLSSGNAVSISITVPAIAGIAASSGADVRATNLTSPALTLKSSSGADIALSGATIGALTAAASSGADIHLSGTCDNLKAEASSGAGIDAEDLICAEAAVQTSSGADISVHATKILKAAASSGGDIDVIGRPAQTDYDTSSGGDISFDD